MIESYSCLCSNDVEWTGNTETSLQSAKDVAAFATPFKPGHCVPGPASESSRWKGNSNEPQGKSNIIALQMVDNCKGHPSLPIFPAIEPLSLGQLWKEEEITTSKVHKRTRRFSSYHIGNRLTMYLQSNLPVVCNRQIGTNTEKMEDEE